MRSTLVTVLVGALLATALFGQTTGIPFMNDYTITCVGCGSATSTCWSSGMGGGLGGVSGSTSCTPLNFNLAAGGTFTFTVTCTPGAQVFIYTNPCLCSPCWLPLGPICGIPFTACGATTNQSVDLNVGCGLNLLFTGFASGTGVFSVTVTVPALPPMTCLQLATQAAITGSISCAGPVVVSQAYDIFVGS
jgi:hypothetical protein